MDELSKDTSFLEFEGDRIPFRTYLSKAQDVASVQMEEVLVRVFYCHGNSQDLYGDWKVFYRTFFKRLRDALQAEMPERRFTVYGMVWDYPLYGLSNVCREELVWSTLPERFLRQAVFVSSVLRGRMQAPHTIDIVYGYSLGSAAACRVFAAVGADILMLQAPFSKFMRCLRNVSAFTKWLVPEYFDNAEEIRAGPKDATIVVDIGSEDEIFDADTVVRDFASINRGDNPLKIATFPMKHEDFLTSKGVEVTCRHLKDAVFDRLMDHVFVTVFPVHLEDSVFDTLEDQQTPDTESKPGECLSVSGLLGQTLEDFEKQEDQTLSELSLD